jgi:hypothetical protein
MAGKELYTEWCSYMGLDPSSSDFATQASNIVQQLQQPWSDVDEAQANIRSTVEQTLSDEDIAAARQTLQPWPEEAGPELATPALPLIANVSGANEGRAMDGGDSVVHTVDTYEESLRKEMALLEAWPNLQTGGSAPQASTSGKKIVILAIYFTVI